MCYILDPNSGFLCRGGSRNCEMGGLAPYEVKCPRRGVRGHAPPEDFVGRFWEYTFKFPAIWEQN